ncbi:hypothetical protein BC828DRAFT_391747, partial [Blastocladiella britannica]
CSVLDNLTPPPPAADHARAYLTLGTVQLRNALPIDAESSLRRALSLHPKSLPAITAQLELIYETLIAALAAQGKDGQVAVFTDKLDAFRARSSRE